MRVIEKTCEGTSADRNEARLAGQLTPRGEPDMKEVHDLGQRLAGMPELMGTAQVTPQEGEDGPPLEVVVDPNAPTTATMLTETLRDDRDLPAPVQQAKERLEKNVVRYQVLAEVLTGGEALLGQLQATERWAAAGELRLVGAFYRRAEELLSGKAKGVDAALLAKLKVALGPVLQVRAESTAERTREADKTRTASAEAAAIVGAAKKEAHLSQTVADLQAERPVSAADLQAAIETFHALEGETQ